VKPFIAAAAACALLVFSVPSAHAQTRTRRSTATAQKRRTTPSPADTARTNTVRLQLANLSKDMTRFLYLYGRLSKDLELTAAQSGSADAANQAKSGLIENVRAMRDRLDQLESQFRFTKGLERQYQSLQGVSARADQAAQQVSAGRYDQAGRTLLDITTQLTDVLLEMP
jgi:recombination DNA repair RAD52 pathway protein